MIRRIGFVAFLLVLSCGAGDSRRAEPRSQNDAAPGSMRPDRSTNPEFARHWRDGRAEMDGYALKIVRYGEERKGECVAIYVTEPFSLSKRVKSNESSLDSEDVVEVLKLNLVIDFSTGIYDYNTMTSVFARTDDFAALKTSFSSAEWCGHVYAEQTIEEKTLSEEYHSYFEDESGSWKLDRPEGGIPEENLFILLRGLNEPFLPAGESRTLPVLPANLVRRLLHLKPEWTPAAITRSAKSVKITVPAGSFETELYEIRVTDGRVGAFWIESTYPRRIVKWTWNHLGFSRSGKSGSREGEYSGELLGSDRLAYWQLNAKGGEANLLKMGLQP